MEQSSPQGEAHHEDDRKIEVVMCGIPGELKHLSSLRKINQVRDSVSSGERKRNSLNPDGNVGGL
jgi:hypothetical protein